MPLPDESSGTWFRRYHQSPNTRERLLLFPHAGGSASFYVQLSQLLSPSVEAFAVQYPGRQDRRSEACVSDLDVLADRITRAVSAWGDEPVAFFGHSMGAVLAYEVARRLKKEGRVQARGLIVSGRAAPVCEPPAKDLHLWDDSDVLAEMRGLGGTDLRLIEDDEIMQMALPAIRGDYQAVADYRYEPGAELDCPISVMMGDADQAVDRAAAERWQEHTSAELWIREFPGGHFYLSPQQRAVAEAITADLPRFFDADR